MGWVLQQPGDPIKLDLEDIKPSVWMTQNELMFKLLMISRKKTPENEAGWGLCE